MAVCFAPAVKTEQREIEKEGYHKLREGKQRAQRSELLFSNTDKPQSASLFQKELEISRFHSPQDVNASYYSNYKILLLFLFSFWKTKGPQIENQKLLSLQREFHTKTSKRQSCDVPSDLRRRQERYCTRNNRKLDFSDASASAYRS